MVSVLASSVRGIYIYTWYMAARFLGKIDTPQTNTHGTWPLAFWLHKGTSVKGGWVELMAISYWIRLLLSCLGPLFLLLLKTFKLFDFPIFRILSYLMKVIPETSSAH